MSQACPETTGYELYDYSVGPVERRNITDEQPEMVKKLHTRLNRHPEAAATRLLSSQK